MTSATLRLIVLTCCFIGAAALSARAVRPEPVPLRESLTHVPAQIGLWTGHAAPPLAPDVVKTLGVDDYVHRLYSRASLGSVALYVGYYQSQRQGGAIHSPLNCLPGAGWQVAAKTREVLRIPEYSGTVSVNRLLIEKGLDRQVVIYWYQSHGRVEASEYRSKAYLIWDAIWRHRSDAAMVRVISPVLPSDPSDAAAANRALRFAEGLFLELERFLPL